VKLMIFEEARLQFFKEDAWWRANRDTKALFAREFLAPTRNIQRLPGAGPIYAKKRGRVIREPRLRYASKGGLPNSSLNY
jgi:hypothetical protein